MNCQEMVEFLMDYFDDELSGGEKRKFDEHLEVCPDCVDYLHSYGETVRLGKMCGQDNEPPPDMPEELVSAILATRRQ